ncbi:MAG: nucleotidyltransferase domain-containing protein [Eubacteriales bacterium]
MNNREQLLKDFTKEVQLAMGDVINKIILYGSYARGDFHVNSDIDIMILTSLTEDKIKNIEDQVYDIAFEYQMSDAITISVNIKNTEQYYYWLGALPYYDNIEREGIVLAG